MFLDDAQQLHSVTSEIAPLPEEEVEANILRESLEKLLSTLDRRKADIFKDEIWFLMAYLQNIRASSSSFWCDTR